MEHSCKEVCLRMYTDGSKNRESRVGIIQITQDLRKIYSAPMDTGTVGVEGNETTDMLEK